MKESYIVPNYIISCLMVIIFYDNTDCDINQLNIKEHSVLKFFFELFLQNFHNSKCPIFFIIYHICHISFMFANSLKLIKISFGPIFLLFITVAAFFRLAPNTEPYTM